MSMNATWNFLFDGATGSWAKQPAVASAGGFPLMAGVDGRYQGVLRRYPGHIRYDRTTSRTVETCREAFPFIIQSGAGSNTKCRGYLACDVSDGKVEAVWRKDDDTADSLRTTDIQATEPVIAHRTSIASTAGISGFYPGAFDGPRNTEVRVKQLLEFTENGETWLVAVGDFESVGARHASGVARYIDGNWEPFGFPGFNAGINCAIVFNNELYVGGNFTKYAGQVCGGLAKWTGDSWAQVGNGLSAEVLCMAEHGGALWVGGTFTETGKGDSTLRVASTDGVTITAKTGTAGFNDGQVNGLASSGSVLFATGTFTADGGTNAIATPVAFLNGGTDWDVVGGTPPTMTVGDSLAYLTTNTSIYLGWRNGTTSHGISSFNGSAWTSELAASGSTLSTTKLYVDLGTANSFIFVAVEDGALATIAACGYTGGSTWTALTGLGGGRVLERTDATLMNGYGIDTTLDVDTSVGVGGETFDLCYAGPYAYLYCSNGNHRVISYDATTDDLVTATLGPGKLYLDAPTLSAQSSSSHNAEAGQYAAAYRYVDRKRNRYTAMSEQGVATATDGDSLRMEEPSTAYSEAPADYDRVQPFTTISSGAATSGAGGTLYRVGEGSIASDGQFAQINYHVTVASTDAGDNGNGTLSFVTSDLSVVQDPTRVYDFVREEVFDVGGVAACATYNGTTFVLERRGGFLDIRWSPTIRYEPENFPSANTYPTEIPSDLMSTCRFIQAGDFLYCFGGSSMYRIQKSGTAVGIIPLHSDYPFVHKNGYVKVGTRIYAVHEMGILQLEGKTGDAVDIPAVRRIFYDRWRGNVVPHLLTTSSVTEQVVCCAYDSKMRCVYFHNRRIAETICLWLSTGKVTIIPHHRAYNCVSMPDLDDKVSVRTYFLDSLSRWVSTPNWDTVSTEPQTLTGSRITTAGASKYNLAVASTFNSLNLGLIFSDTPGPSPSGSMAIGVLSGTDAGKVYWGTWSSTSRFDITSAATTNIAAGDVISVDPVVFELLGANLWEPRNGQPLFNARKRIDRMTLKANRISSPGTTAESSVTPLDGNYGQFLVGTLRTAEVEANEPITSSTNRKLVPRQSAQMRPGVAISAESGDNWTRVVDEGTDLYPYLLCLVSNYAFELTSWTVAGSIYGGDRVGS